MLRRQQLPCQPILYQAERVFARPYLTGSRRVREARGQVYGVTNDRVLQSANGAHVSGEGDAAVDTKAKASYVLRRCERLQPTLRFNGRATG